MPARTPALVMLRWIAACLVLVAALAGGVRPGPARAGAMTMTATCCHGCMAMQSSRAASAPARYVAEPIAGHVARVSTPVSAGGASHDGSCCHACPGAPTLAPIVTTIDPPRPVAVAMRWSMRASSDRTRAGLSPALRPPRIVRA